MSLSIIQTADPRLYDPPQRLLEPRGRRMVRPKVPRPISVPNNRTQTSTRAIHGTCSGTNFVQPREGRAQEGRGLRIPSPPPVPEDARWWRSWVRWLLGI